MRLRQLWDPKQERKGRDVIVRGGFQSGTQEKPRKSSKKKIKREKQWLRGGGSLIAVPIEAAVFRNDCVSAKGPGDWS